MRALVAVISLNYALIPLARPLAEWLRARGLLSGTVLLLFAVAALFVLREARRDARKRPLARPPARASGGLGAWLPLALAVSVVALGWYLLPLPEERLHLVQYGAVGYAAVRAFGSRFLAPAAISGLAGFGDELLQAVAPGRFFDWRDVGLNLGGAALGIAISLTRQR